MQLKALVIALQGVGFGPFATALQGLVSLPEENLLSPAGGAKGKKHFAPWHWVPFHPVPARRPRKKRNAAILFLGQ